MKKPSLRSFVVGTIGTAVGVEPWTEVANDWEVRMIKEAVGSWFESLEVPEGFEKRQNGPMVRYPLS